jgi:magnesium-transporting ATPase (P-type)
MIIGTYMTYLFTTPLAPESTVGTLIVVLMITSVKELFDDLNRGKSDKFENTRAVNVVTFDEEGCEVLVQKESKYVCPGDIIKLEGTMPSPCDLLLILTSLHGDGNKCYIETANIDGETNLKVREAPPGLTDAFPEAIMAGTYTYIHIHTPIHLLTYTSIHLYIYLYIIHLFSYSHTPTGVPTQDMFNGSMSFEQPNKNIHTFVGTLQLTPKG